MPNIKEFREPTEDQKKIAFLAFLGLFFASVIFLKKKQKKSKKQKEIDFLDSFSSYKKE